MPIRTPTNSNVEAIQAIMLGGATAVVAYDGSTQSVVLTAEVVRVVSTTDCHIEAGANPTATTSSAFLPAGSAEYFGIVPGQRIAAVKASGASAGSLYITAAL